MAGLLVTDPTKQLQAEIATQSQSQISPIIEQWQIQYARFISYISGSTQASLSPLAAFKKQNLRGGTWISSSSFTSSLNLVYGGSNGISDATLVLSVRAKVLEEHYISKLQFSWPQVSCVSGYPSRGSRAVFVGYKDGAGQIQKFAFRFLTSHEAEHFMNILKEILGSARVQQFPSATDFSNQAESVRSIEPAYRPEENWQHTNSTSADTDTNLMPPTDNAQDSNPKESSENVADKEIIAAFPPSFTSLLMNYCPVPNNAEPAETVGSDLKTQIMKYFEGSCSSLKDIEDAVENVIKELGDDMMF